MSRRHLHGRCDGGARGSLCHERPPGATNGLPAPGGPSFNAGGRVSRGTREGFGQVCPPQGCWENHR